MAPYWVGIPILRRASIRGPHPPCRPPRNHRLCSFPWDAVYFRREYLLDMALFLRSTSIALGAFVLCSASYAQTAISARSGMVHYSEGDVTVAGEPLDT